MGWLDGEGAFYAGSYRLPAAGYQSVSKHSVTCELFGFQRRLFSMNMVVSTTMVRAITIVPNMLNTLADFSRFHESTWCMGMSVGRKMAWITRKVRARYELIADLVAVTFTRCSRFPG